VPTTDGSTAEFVISAASPRDFPRQGLPEIVIAGRSNVGKSSLINAMTGCRNLARTSATPGKTRTINFYRLQDSWLLVDLPGYGYARVPKAEGHQWKKLVNGYFLERPAVALVIQLVDSRMEPTEQDLQLSGWLDSTGIPRLVVGTKADKLSGNERAVQQRRISEAFGGNPVILSSARTGAGCREIWKRAAEAAGNHFRSPQKLKPQGL
jgi:GTP-binding protein